MMGYSWTDNSPLDYTNWYPGEPNDYGGTEECGEAFVNSARGWNDDACEKQKNWICKIPKGKVPITPSPPPAPGSPCPSDPAWVYRAPYCYYYSEPTGDGRLSFDEAEDFCHEGGGHLASIHDQDEQNFINSLLRANLVGEYWIGLKDRNLGSGVFEWVDDTPYDYTSWKPGQPDFNNGLEGCGATEVESSGGANWKDQACGIRQTFICKKDYDNVIPITHEPTTPTPGGCPTDWLKLNNRCYHLEGGNDQNKWTDWQTARDRCAGLLPGAILATIHSQLTQSELTSYLYYIQSDVWIGLTDQGQQGKFHWVDGTTLDYTNWLPGQPSDQIVLPGGGRDDCTVMTNDPDHPGRWNDISCDDTHAFMCEASPNILYPDIPIPREVCIKSSYYKYGQDCYKVEPTLMTFANAKAFCENDGTVLATIADGYQEAFVEIMVTKYGDRVWIGLVDDQSDGRFKWLDGWPLYYTDWANNEPSLRNGEECVVVKTNGRWDNVPCSELHYPICKDTLASPPPTIPPGEGTCPSGWLEFGSWCYKFDVARDYASWVEADADCKQSHGATLASIHSKQENEFIRTNAYTSVGLRGIWINMRRGFGDQFENTDGTPVDYVNWANNEPTGAVNGVNQDCVELYPDSYGKWNDEDCTKAAGYVCKLPKMVPTSPTPPRPTSSSCPTEPSWFYNYPYCYYVSTAIGTEIKSWKNAESWCNTKGGYLASIHSNDEQDYIMSILLQLIPSFWIGLRETTGQNDYGWSDGTYVDYVNWDQGQPDDYAGQEACVEMHPLTTAGEWNDLACGVEQAFICKKRWDSTTPIEPPTTKPPIDGGCPSDWYKLDNKCYKLYGGGGTAGVLTWDESKLACQSNPGGDLASIHYQGVQSLLTALMKDHPGANVWIGLSDKGSFRKFYWSDGSDLDYTNWAVGEPDGSITNPSGTDCVEMTNDPDHPGKWDDTTCDLDRMYMCQMPVDPLETGGNPDLPNTCTQAGYQSYFDGCYKLDEIPRTYDTARTACENDGAFLASIGDGYDEAFVETVLLKKGYAAAWIGLRQNPDTKEFGWVDGWPLLYTNWAENEPGNNNGEGCVTVTSGANWDNINCGVKQVSICKYTSAEKPTTPAPVDGICPNGWVPYGASCYLFDVASGNSRYSWNEASLSCKAGGGDLASIHTKAENEFVRAKAEQLQNTNGMWLGMTLDAGNNLIWSDGSPVDYVNFASGEPDGSSITDSGCVEMYPTQYGKWDDKDCQLGTGYACKQPKMPLEVTTRRFVTQPPGMATTGNGVSQQPAKQSDGPSAGLVVGVLMAVLFIVLAVFLVGFFLYQKRNKDKAALADITLGSTSFANVLYESKTEALGVEMIDKSEPAPGGTEA